jgi:hypothetical protein
VLSNTKGQYKMAFRMSGLVRTKSGAFKARKGIPADVRDDYQALYAKRWEEIFNAPADCPPQRAKVQHSEWEAEVDNRIATLRAKRRGEGHDLTHREVHALAGEWYRWFTTPYEDNPGSPDRWDTLSEILNDLIPIDQEIEGIDWDEVHKELHPLLADEAKTAQFLASRWEVLTPAAMESFLDAVLWEYLHATRLLSRWATGDYAPDQHLQTLPKYRKPEPVVVGTAKTASCHELFEAYVKDVQPRASTTNRWRTVFTTLDEYLDGTGRAPGDLTGEEAQNWADSLVTGKRGKRTVRDIWVSASHTVFAWALKKKRISVNPFGDVTVAVPREVRTREEGKALSPSEQRVILQAALAITDTKSPFKAACRWAPWLCAYSGARAGEITQLRKQDIQRRDGFVVMKITPDAGTVKGSMPE